MKALCLITVVCLPASLAVGGTPHPFHTSTAEVEFNTETKRFEVALKLYGVDVENALSKLDGKRCDLDDEASRDKLMARYLTSHFTAEAIAKTRKPGKGNAVQKKAKQPPKLNYVGSEIVAANVWAYFELTAPVGDKDFQLRNDVLTEVQREQLNIVRFRGPAGQQTLYFNGRNKKRLLSLSRKVSHKPIAD